MTLGKTLAFLALAAPAILGGCRTIYSPPLPPDPFAETPSTPRRPASFPKLTAAVVVSKKTETGLDYLRSDEKGLGYIDMKGVVDSVCTSVRGAFRGLAKVKNAEEAAGISADLVAVLDMTFRLPKDGAGRLSVSAQITFWTLDKRQIVSVRGEGSARQGGSKALVAAVREARERLEQAVRASPELAQLDSSRTGTPKPAAEAVALIDSDVDKPGYASTENPDDYAVVVGIDKYSSLPPARFAERDAAAVRAHLIALGYSPRNIAYLTGAQAGRAALAKYIEAWLPRNVGPRSRVFFYFSGHGAPDVKTGLPYLMPWDGDAQFLESTGYPVKNLYQNLSSLPAKEIIVAMDSCFSGAGGRSVLAEGARPLVNRTDDSSGELKGKDRLVVFSAAADDETTGTLDEQGHGLFTYYFLKGLERSKGAATVKSLYSYLLPNVQDGARRENRGQTPRLLSSDLGRGETFLFR